METIELTDGALLLYDEGFLPPELAARYVAELRDQCAWEQKPGVFGNTQPRLTASCGDVGVTYRYSCIENVALPWTATLLEIKERIEAVRGTYNHCLLNCFWRHDVPKTKENVGERINLTFREIVKE